MKIEIDTSSRLDQSGNTVFAFSNHAQNIGKKSPAHDLALKIFRKQKKPNKVLNAQKIINTLLN
ncbi:hypothetical protein CL633_00365 [bacterium]|nr:hypothetical protein [bacterium]